MALSTPRSVIGRNGLITRTVGIVEVEGKFSYLSSERAAASDFLEVCLKAKRASNYLYTCVTWRKWAPIGEGWNSLGISLVAWHFRPSEDSLISGSITSTFLRKLFLGGYSSCIIVREKMCSFFLAPFQKEGEWYLGLKRSLNYRTKEFQEVLLPSPLIPILLKQASPQPQTWWAYSHCFCFAFAIPTMSPPHWSPSFPC